MEDKPMSKPNHVTMNEEQKTTKPKIEDVINHFVDGETLKNAMAFIAYLRENNMNPRWASANSWRVTGKKSKPICRIDLGGLKHAWMRHLQIGDWQICELEGLDRTYLDEFASSDEIKAFVWDNIKICNRCCSCGPRQWTYINKLFDTCCGFKIKNPDAKGLEIIKKLVETNKRHIYENA